MKKNNAFIITVFSFLIILSASTIKAQTTKTELAIDSIAYFNFNDPNDITDSSLSTIKCMSYDSLGNKTVLEYTISNAQRVAISKSILYFDSKKRVISNEQYNPVSNGLSWLGKTKTDYEYSATGNDYTSITKSYWDNSENTWLKMNAVTYKYNPQNSIIEVINSGWATAYLKMIDTAKTVFIRNANEQLDTVKRYHRTGTTYIPDSLTVYYRDKKGNDTAIVYKIWKNQTKVYEKIKTISIEHAVQENSVTEITSVYDTVSKTDVFTNKTFKAFDKFGNDTLIIDYSYNSGNWNETIKQQYAFDKYHNTLLNSSYSFNNPVWEGKSKDSTVYDKNNNQLSFTSYLWDYATSTWYPSYQIKNIYNNKNKVDSLYYSIWDYSDKALMVLTKTSCHYDSNDTLLFKSIFFNPPHAPFSFLVNKEYNFYSTHDFVIPKKDSIVSSVPETTQDIVVIPNPASDVISISNKTNIIEEVTMYSILGEKLFSIICYNQIVTIPVNEFSNGVYLLMVKSEGVCKTTKMVISK